MATVLPAGAERREATARYIIAWVIAAVGSTSLLLFLSEPGDVDSPEAALLLAVAVATEGVILHLHHGRSREFVSLVEVAVALNILLLPASAALAITLVGIALGNLLHKRHPLKLIFNLAQYAVATAAAIFVFHLIRGEGSFLDLSDVGALLAGMTAFGIINGGATSGIFSLLEDRPFGITFKETWRISALTVFGNSAIGIITVVVWRNEPALAPLLIVPALILHLAYRGVVTTQELLETVTSERDRLDRIVSGASDGIALLDADALVGVWNPAMEILTGVPAGEAVGAAVGNVLIGTDTEGGPVDPSKPLSEASNQEPVHTVEMLVPHRHGGSKVVKVRHTALFGADGKPMGDAIMVDDVTRERETERLKDDFLARVSHELRTPLTPIKGYAQTLLRKSDVIPEQVRTEALELIVERVDHMEDLINDLLLVSRIVAGTATLKDQIRPDVFDLRELCEKVLSDFRTSEPERRFELEANDPVAILEADPSRVEQIMANLVSNACKYSEPSTLVTLRIRRATNRFMVDVLDRGRGIPADHIERIFERFHRVEDPLLMETDGVGLGLHIARSLAKAMEGELSVQSRLGSGSTFTLSLPAGSAAP